MTENYVLKLAIDHPSPNFHRRKHLYSIKHPLHMVVEGTTADERDVQPVASWSLRHAFLPVVKRYHFPNKIVKQEEIDGANTTFIYKIHKENQNFGHTKTPFSWRKKSPVSLRQATTLTIPDMLIITPLTSVSAQRIPLGIFNCRKNGQAVGHPKQKACQLYHLRHRLLWSKKMFHALCFTQIADARDNFCQANLWW